MATLKFTSNLKRFFPDLKPIESSASTIRLAIEEVDQRHKGIKSYLLNDSGSLREHVNVYINDGLIIDRQQLSDKISSTDEVFFMQAISGG